MNILFIDPIFGISGDMLISAFLDAGMPFQELYDLLAKIPIDMPEIKPAKMNQSFLLLDIVNRL